MTLPAQLTAHGQPVTVTAIYPDDGARGSLTFDTASDHARGAVFLTNQNGKDPADVLAAACVAALEAKLASE